MAEGILDIQSVTLDSSNYSLGRLITVTGQSDCTNEADISYTIDAVSVSSTDTDFNALTASKPALNQNVILSPSIMVIQSSGQVNRGAGAYNNFQAKLSCQPPADEVMNVTVNGLPNGFILYSPLGGTHTFTAANWNAPVDVILQVTSDLDGAYQVDLSSTTYGSASVYFGDSGTKRLTINVTGLAGKTTLKNGSDSISFQAPGTFYWHLTTGLPYALELSAQPAGQVCAIKESQFGTTTLPFTININCVNGYMTDSGVLNMKPQKLDYKLYQGKVSTLADIHGVSGGSSSALTYFNDKLYIADTTNNAIHSVVVSAQTVTTNFISGVVDGASISGPYGMANDGTNLYFIDQGNHRIIKANLSTGTFIHSYSTETSATSFSAAGLALDIKNQILYVAIRGTDAHEIKRLNLASGQYISSISDSLIHQSTDLVLVKGSLYVANLYNHNILKISNPETDTPVVEKYASAASGYEDGPRLQAKFRMTTGITTDGTDLYVTEMYDSPYSHRIRRIDIDKGIVSTIAGNGASGTVNGIGINAQIGYPAGIATDGRSFYTVGYRFVRKITDNGLVGYWPLAGNAIDYSSDFNSTPPGVWTGTKAYSTTDRFGVTNNEGGGDFPGSTQGTNYISTKDISFVDAAPFTIAAWIKTSDINTDRGIVGKLGGEYGFHIMAGGTLRFLSWEGGGTAHLQAKSGIGQIKVGEWTHVAYVYRGPESAGGKVYINGHNATAFHSEGTGPIGDLAENVMIGGNINSTSDFLGNIADVRIYNRALNEGEINELAQDASQTLVGASYNTGAVGLLSHYSFTGAGSPEGLIDTGALGNSLQLPGAPNNPIPDTGKDGDANGSSRASLSQYLFANGSGLPLDNSARTMCAWINPDKYNNGFSFILHYGGNTLGGTGSMSSLALSYDAQIHKIAVLGKDGLDKYYPYQVPLNTWTHLCFTYSDPDVELFVNGSSQGKFTLADSWVTIASDLSIGTWPGYPNYFSGKVDDVRIYNRALSVVEVRQLAVQVPAGLVARYDFTGDAKDMSGWADNNQVNINGAVLTPDRFGNADGAYYFNGASYISASQLNSLPFGGASRTMCAFIRNNTGAVNQEIFSYGDLSTAGLSGIVYNNTDITLHGNTADLVGTNAALTNVWQHVCAVYNEASSAVYVNGALINSGIPSPNATWDTPATGNDLYIGKIVPGLDFYFTGDIDDVRVYNRALEGAEIRAMLPDSGTLDSSFNGVGYVTHDNAAGGNQGDIGKSTAIQSDGKIVIAGQSKNLSGNHDMVIWRYNSDSTLDTTFNGVGYTVHNNAAGGNSNDYVHSTGIQGDGKIVVTGESYNAAGNNDMAIWRYNSNGTLDTTFNGVGYVTHNSAAGGNSHDFGYSTAMQTNDKIVVTGISYNASGKLDMVIWRYNSDGTLDTTFNGVGYVTHNSAAGGNSHDYGYSTAIQADGKIVVTGESYNAAGNLDMVIWRYNTNGALDTTFNGVGYVTHHNAAGGNRHDSGRSLVLQSDGKIVVTGFSENMYQDMAIWRYNSNGTLDTTFNGVGYVTHSSAAGGNSYDSGHSVISQPDGKIVVAGESTSTANTDIAIWRYNPDGTLDTNFNGVGYAVHNGAAGGNGDDYSYGIARQTDGSIVITGTSFNGTDNDMVIWRYHP
ncbi:MAG: hypothetical protein OEZ13_05760 [Spirochaetia bacterium]|nr:hypothetical protein [Spirochaetia bacterium]